jgi:hypothetical protein
MKDSSYFFPHHFGNKHMRKHSNKNTRRRKIERWRERNDNLI